MFRYFKKKRFSKILQDIGFWSKTKKNPAIVLQDNDMTIAYVSATAGWRTNVSDKSKNSGNFVFEITLLAAGHSIAGFSVRETLNYDTYMTDTPNTGTAGIYFTSGGSVNINPGTYGITNLSGPALNSRTIGDVIAFAFNMTEGKCYIYLNGVLKGAYFGGLTGKTIYPVGSLWGNNSKLKAVSKSAEFKYSYPGYVGFSD